MLSKLKHSEDTLNISLFIILNNWYYKTLVNLCHNKKLDITP